MAKSRTYSITTIKRLYANSGNLCCMYGCNQKLINDKYNMSKIAHIASLNSKDLRYDPNLTEEQLNSYDNLILLCSNHHEIIDAPANRDIYTIEYLKIMKKEHEREVSSRKNVNVNNFNDNDFFNVRVETQGKKDIEAITEKLSDVFELSTSPVTYQKRETGYYHYIQHLKIKNISTSKENKNTTVSIDDKIVKKALQFITNYGRYSLDNFMNMFPDCSKDKNIKKQFKNYILEYAWKEDKEKVANYLEALKKTIRILKFNKADLQEATQKIIDITNEAIGNNDKEIKYKNYIRKDSKDYILCLERNIEKFKDEYITFEEVTEMILNITYNARNN